MSGLRFKRTCAGAAKAGRWLLAGVLAVQSPIFAAAATLPVPVPQAVAERALMQGHVDEAVGTLQGILAAHPQDGEAHLLLCRAFYSEDRADEAVSECESALQTLGRSSDAQDWMGRAYGKKADLAGPIQGLRLARSVKTAFETAVELNALNGAAVNDLSEYYVNAPSMIGGGLDRAEALADRSQARLPQQAHRIRALVAEKRRDFGSAEREFRAAVEVAGRADAWVDLGAFFGRRKDYGREVEALRHAVYADREHDASLVDVASILVETRQDARLAEESLRLYLESPNKSDAGPVVRVHLLLGKLLVREGNRPGAKIEFGRALELASNYTPARRALADS